MNQRCSICLAICLLPLTSACMPEIQQTLADFTTGLLLLYASAIVIACIAAFTALLFIFRHESRAQDIWVPIVNVVRPRMGFSRVYKMPYRYVEQERKMVVQAAMIVQNVERSLRLNSNLTKDRRVTVERQMQEIPENLVSSLWRLQRLRQLMNSVDGLSQDQEMKELDFKLQVQMEHSLQMLKSLPITLIKIEQARNDRAYDHLVEDLEGTNAEMRDLAASYDDLRSARSRLGR